MFYFSYALILRYLKFSEIVILLFLMMTILSMMPRNVWGEGMYNYRDKDGTIVITDRPPPQKDISSPQENVPSDTGKSRSYQDSIHIKKSKSYQDLTPEERLHWGRDNALNDKKNKGINRQRKTVGSIDAGRYEVKIKKISSNLYQDISTRIIIKTDACVESAGGDESLLDWTGSFGELFFKNTNKSCMVKKVYK